MKFCSKCNIVKEYCEFSKDSSKKDGLYSSCKKCVNESKKLYYIKNKEKCKKRSIEYTNKNIERISSLIRNSTKHNYKNTKSKDILGINIENFKIYIENQFKDGMSWNNYGKWQLDHKVPISIANNKEEFYKLNHYTNFRPRWKIDNIKKSNKILDEFKELKNTLLNFCN